MTLTLTTGRCAQALRRRAARYEREATALETTATCARRAGQLPAQTAAARLRGFARCLRGEALRNEQALALA